MNRNLTILVIEDDENDILILERALKKNDVRNPINICRDVDQALTYLGGGGQYADRTNFPFPSVLFTDLKMPKKSGFDVLKWLKDHPDYRVVPVIVLTSSREERDVAEAFKLGANSYITKPSTFEEWERMMRVVYEYWCWNEKPKMPEKC